MQQDIRAKFYIYRNLVTGGFSVRHRGIVVDRISRAIAHEVTFKVSSAGRDRVLRERQKNVHAFVVASSVGAAPPISTGTLAPVSYNPYTAATFTCNGQPIHSARTVLFDSGRCYLIPDEDTCQNV